MIRLLFVFVIFITCNCALKSQSIALCDTLAIFYNQIYAPDYKRFSKILEHFNQHKLNKYVLKNKCELHPNSNLIRNLFFTKSYLKNNKRKKYLTLLEIKLQPLLNESLREYNGEVFLAALNPVDIKFGSNAYMRQIKKKFGMVTYFKVLSTLNKPLRGIKYLEVKRKFREETPPNQAVWKTEKWFAALLLANQKENDAEEYILNIARNLTKPGANREAFKEIGYNLLLTKNRKLINFIIDEFLMSDYEWSDYDHGSSDFWYAYQALPLVVDEPFIEQSLIMYPDDKTFRAALRQWFKDHRETYKIKP